MPEQRQPIYLDHAAAAPLLPEVAAGHAALCRDYFFNPHAGNLFSERVKGEVDAAARRLLGLLGIEEGAAEVIWTSGGTESDNLGCLGFLRARAGAAVAVDATAHNAMLEPCRQWRREGGGDCVELPVDKAGRLLVPAGAEAGGLPSGLRLLAVCHVNNETGVIQDLPGIRAVLRSAAPRAALMVDAAQSFGKLPVPWETAGIDLLALSAHKLGGPAGVGALVCRAETRLQPLFFGGAQQRGRRPGTVDAVGVLEFVRAAEIMCAGMAENRLRTAALNARLRQLLRERLADDFIFVSPDDASPYILNFCFPDRYEGAVLMRALAQRGVVVAAGSACSAETAATSHVLKAMGLPRHQARGALRVSFGQDTVPAALETFVEALTAVLREY